MSRVWKSLTWIAAGSALFISAAALPSFFESTYSAPMPFPEKSPETVSAKIAPVVTHLETPEPLKALYVTSCVAATPSWRRHLKELIETTELNAIVIDIKDYTGAVSFPRDFPKALFSQDLFVGPGCVAYDMREFVQTLHEANIYVIGRISVFQDPSYVRLFPELAVRKESDGEIWKDYKGLSFVDVGAKPYWEYIVEISKEAYALGFDELNYDYVRYPSDGNMQDISYVWTTGTTTKAEMLENFFSFLGSSLEETGVTLSVDLFGMTTTVWSDLGIGQTLESVFPHFDYISPMVYPSHYPATWNGFPNPAEYPYEVVKIAMTRGIERERAYNLATGNFYFDEFGATTTPKSKFRPWLQDFDLGADYDAAKVRAQIQATYDAGLTSWMLWNAGNKYTAEALLPN